MKFRKREGVMTVAKMISAIVAAITIVSSGAQAQAPQSGRIITVDPKGSIRVEHPRNGQPGASTVVDDFKLQDGLPVSGLKAGDKISFAATQVGGLWTVTQIQKQ
jgi:Cu/Ag efflux protein CusF